MMTAANTPATTERLQSELAPQPSANVLHYLERYCQDNPGSAALWCLGIGFVLGWKLRPW